jgi:DNA-directed RNA polymerase subunit K/omega
MADVPFAACRPAEIGAFEFVVVSTLRAAQLMRGCTPRIDGGNHKATVIAQREVAMGRIARVAAVTPPTL